MCFIRSCKTVVHRVFNSAQYFLLRGTMWLMGVNMSTKWWGVWTIPHSWSMPHSRVASNKFQKISATIFWHSFYALTQSQRRLHYLDNYVPKISKFRLSQKSIFQTSVTLNWLGYQWASFFFWKLITFCKIGTQEFWYTTEKKWSVSSFLSISKKCLTLKDFKILK